MKHSMDKRLGRNGEKGTALLIVLIMTIVAMGILAPLFIMTQNAALEQQDLASYRSSHEIAEIALNNSVEQIRSYIIANSACWVAANLDSGSVDTRSITGTISNIPYKVQVRSAFLAYQAGTAGGASYLKDTTGTRDLSSSEDYDVYEVTAVSGQSAAAGGLVGVGRHDYRSGIRAIVEIKKSNGNGGINSPLYIENDPEPQFSGNAFGLSGEDHDMNAAAKTASLTMPYSGTCEFTYQGSTAGLKSGFFYVDPATGEEIVIFASNEPGVQNAPVNQTFSKDQALNFFARTDGSSWGIGTYDHYTEGSSSQGDPWCTKYVLNEDGKTYLQDGTLEYTERRDGSQNVYKAGTNTVVQPINIDLNTDLTEYTHTNDAGQRVVTIRYGIEDLPAEYQTSWSNTVQTPDWDYDDIVVDVDVIETGESDSNTTTETPWWDMNEQDALTGNGGTEAIGASPLMIDSVTNQYVDKDGYLVNGDGDYVKANGKKTNTPVTAENPVQGSVTEQWDNYGISLNQEDQIRCDGVDEEGDHVGFDREAVDEGTADINDRSVAQGSNAFTQSKLDLRQLAADIVGGTKEDPGSSLNDNVTQYSKVGNGNNHNDIGSKDNMKVTYIDGDAGTIAGQIEGGGVLVIDGDLHISGKFAFAGIIIVLGDVHVTGGGNSIHMLGSLMVEGQVKITGNADIWWSQNAVDSAVALVNLQSAGKAEYRVWKQLDKADVDTLGL